MGNYNRYFIAQESDWEKEKAEHDKVDDGLDVLIQLDRTIDRAFDILSNDKYGNMSRYYYDSIAGRINKCKEKNNNITNYANGIYGVLEDKENDFHKQLSRAMESLSKLDIDEYEVDNTLQIKEYQSYMDYSESGGYQGTSNGTLKYREVKKKKITFSDIQAKTDMFQLQDQFANYLKENGKDGKHVPDAEVDKLKKQFYSQQLSTSFDHTVYNDSWWATLSTTLDYIPLVGGLKSIVEGFVGTTMTGEQLSANEKLQYVLMGAVSVAVDCFTFGTATAAVQGTKAVVKEGAKIIAKDVLTGWSLNLGSQVLVNMDLPPQLAFVAHIGLNIAISRSNIKKANMGASGAIDDLANDVVKGASGANIDDIVKKTGLPKEKIDELLIKSNLSVDELNNALKTKSYDDILRELNPKSRLPKTNGRWEGQRGDGLWFSDNPKVQAITSGEGIKFQNGRPSFSQWSKGKIEFEPGVLNGSQDDFNAVYDKIMELKPELKSRNQVKNWLSEVGLTPHHDSTTIIDLIPTDLHSNVPHIGAASDLRGGF